MLVQIVGVLLLADAVNHPAVVAERVRNPRVVERAVLDQSLFGSDRVGRRGAY